MSYKIGWFSTGRDGAARNLLEAVYNRRSELGIEMPFVFSNWERGEDGKYYDERQMFCELVDEYSVPFVGLSWRKFKEEYGKRWRDEFGRVMRQELKSFEHDLDVLAGYMLWVDNETCRRYRMINLHPALPGGPVGTWQKVIWELMETRARETGAMMHRVTEEWDRGPVVTYCRFSIRGDDYDPYWDLYEAQRQETSFEKIRARYSDDIYPLVAHPLFKKIREEGETREIPLMIHTIREFARGNVRFEEHGVVDRDGRVLEEGLNITELVERELD